MHAVQVSVLTVCYFRIVSIERVKGLFALLLAPTMRSLKVGKEP